jgi:hypothetical protein
MKCQEILCLAGWSFQRLLGTIFCAIFYSVSVVFVRLAQ